jgi:hypothetical protein
VNGIFNRGDVIIATSVFTGGDIRGLRTPLFFWLGLVTGTLPGLVTGTRRDLQICMQCFFTIVEVDIVTLSMYF